MTAITAVAAVTYPVLVNDIYDCHQFSLMGPEGNVGDAADLNVALEHLEDTNESVYGTTRGQLFLLCQRYTT